MTDHQPLAQSIHEGVEVDASIEAVKWGCAGVRTCAVAADSMASRAHPLREQSAPQLKCARRRLG